MTAADRRRAAGALAGAAAVALVLGACASMPDHGAVMESTVQVDTAREIAFNVQGPAVDADPEQLVQSFVSVAQFAPANASTANVAREYVLPSAWSGWDRTSRVLVLSQYPEWETGVVDDEATTATVTGQAQVVATVDEIGVYTELPEPSPVDVSFELSRAAGGQWRISGLDDGLLVLANFLGDSFHRTTLSYPTPDREWWVPDVRWFPEQSWRTAATREILAGPPADLAHSTISVVPDGTTLALDAVTVDDSGVIEVSVTSPIGGASAEDRALLVAQLSETLRDREGRSVVLSEGTSPLATQSVTEPSRPLTVGDALALVEVDGATVLRRVVGRELTDTAQAYVLDGLDPTALGVAPDDGTVVVRDGTDRLVRVSGEAPVELLVGDGLASPSVDRFGTVWTADSAAVRAVLPDGGTLEVDGDWTDARHARSVAVSPEGARIAVVLDGPAGPETWVAAVQRDADDAPTGLSEAVRVGAPVAGVTSAAWFEESTLLLLGRDPDGADALYLAGIGGLAGAGGGESRQYTAPTGVTQVTSGVGGGSPPLVVDADGTLQVRQSAALWPSVSEDVVAVTYPG
ncbi:lipoprotein LpqB-like beta-propeller protein [Isoptericola jiangsuensis]|uniref:Lipoprotein LpqB-like beta-propeller protein n=1 Tax=Isoptericola jiangsuensis TaxID=548579 RepID=A0A2A9F0K0_9MICO|nr:LpqB family beta-propeller domain-containing protein [Isoptericola jiangsuensis]PFG44030.1 lipoprotein LpqB-like beta-propeller protein [Isoptericola jiangsuensis]